MKIYFQVVAILVYINNCIGSLDSVLEKIREAQLSNDGLADFINLSKKYFGPSVAEEYDIITEDGYILKLFHIPGNTSNVILFSHGLLGSSDDYLLRGNTSLLYITVMQGFDVWVTNVRGNRYSRRHVSLNPDTDQEFWEFSQHEIGIYDYKANIDFVLQKTGNRRLSLVGYSQGTTTFFILASVRPEYNKKIKVFIGLASHTYFKHTSLAMATLLKLSTVLSPIQNSVHMNEVAGYNSSITKLVDIVCSSGAVSYRVCFTVFGAFTGFSSKNIEKEFASTIFGHFPAGSSRKNLVHEAQCYIHKRFAQYDYGKRNIKIYGSFEPPLYNIKKITTRVVMFASKGDKLVTINDAERLSKELPNVVYYGVVDDEKFGHLDYMWGRNAHVKLYPFVIDMLHKYEYN